MRPGAMPHGSEHLVDAEVTDSVHGMNMMLSNVQMQVQWTSAWPQPAHFSVQYRSEPTCRCLGSCARASDPQTAHFHPSAASPHFAHNRVALAAIVPLRSDDSWRWAGPPEDGPLLPLPSGPPLSPTPDAVAGLPHCSRARCNKFVAGVVSHGWACAAERGRRSAGG
jgi:hypothetical protein